MRARLSQIIRLLACMLAILPMGGPLHAQFYSYGEEPASIRWSQIRTKDYRIVYPRGLDSLARSYATLLEQVKMPVGAGVGRYPNQFYKRPMPVILHAWSVVPNGMVTWAPRQMDLITTPDPSAPMPLAWDRQLVIHESRHVAQMQFVNEGPYRPWNWIMGQAFAGVACCLYTGHAFLEGDAVLAETELTGSGRGRSADFLEYLRMSFLNGDKRDYWQWRYGSLTRYTPDYYRAGYLRMAGIRTMYNAPDLTRHYYDRIFAKRHWPWPLFNWQKTVKDVSGKSFRKAFAEVCDSLTEEWRANDSCRFAVLDSPAASVTSGGNGSVDPPHFVGPLPFREPKSPEPLLAFGPRRRSMFPEFLSLSTLKDGNIYAVHKGLDKASEIVRIHPDGTLERVQSFSSRTSAVKADSLSGRLWWSEIRNDPRWGMRSYSEIRYTDSLGVGKHTLKRRTRWFNPSPSPDGSLIAAVEYPVAGGSRVIVLDWKTGNTVEIMEAPDSIQAVEAEWVGGKVYVSGIITEGEGIYCASDGFREVMAPQPSTIKQLFSHDGMLYFTMDRTGVNELHSLDVTTGELRQHTVTSNGASEFRFNAGSDTLYYSAIVPEGRLPFKVATDSLVSVTVSPSDRYEQHIARELSSTREATIDYGQQVEVSDPKPYVKAAHLLRFHTWAPIYLDYDEVSSISLETISTVAGLGATAFFQNDLDNASGYIGWKTGWDSDGKWENALKGQILYKGQYPVIDASITVSNDHPATYFVKQYWKKFMRYTALTSKEASNLPLLHANIKAYIPLSFNSGGWNRGLIPQVQASMTNSVLVYGKAAPMNRLSTSLRGYMMTAIPSSCVYPRWGAGFEVGASGRIGATSLFSPNIYAYGYGYVPGILRTHGIKLTGIVQKQLGKSLFSENYATVVPRGYTAAGGATVNIAQYPLQSRVTADYVMPFASVDWSGMCPVAYVKNFEFTLKGDYGVYTSSTKQLNLASAGLDIAAVLGNFIWLPFDTRVGMSFWYNFGSMAKKPYYIGLLFSMDI